MRIGALGPGSSSPALRRGPEFDLQPGRIGHALGKTRATGRPKPKAIVSAVPSVSMGNFAAAIARMDHREVLLGRSAAQMIAFQIRATFQAKC
jgi:hypothetical protein